MQALTRQPWSWAQVATVKLLQEPLLHTPRTTGPRGPSHRAGVSQPGPDTPFVELAHPPCPSQTAVLHVPIGQSSLKSSPLA
jgi:hypothetical protein